MKLRFLKTRIVKSPSRGDGGLNDLSAGLDFYIPSFDIGFENDLTQVNKENDTAWYDEEAIYIAPQGRCLIPTGIKLNLQTIDGVQYDVENGIALIAHNRGSVGSKGIVHGACVVDEDFQGELFMSVINTTDENVSLPYGSKLLQFLLIPIMKPTMVEVSTESELFPTVSNRGEGALGSTNT